MISKEEFEAALSPTVVVALTDDAGTGEANEEALFAAALVAEEEVRARVAPALKLDDAAELAGVLREAALALAVDRLFARRREIPPAPWAQRAADARALLRDIAAGRLRPPGIPARPAVTKTRLPEQRLRLPDDF